MAILSHKRAKRGKIPLTKGWGGIYFKDVKN